MYKWRRDPPVGEGCDLSGVVFEALAVLLYGFFMLSFLHQGVAFVFQSLAFLNFFITGSWWEEKQGQECEDVSGETDGQRKIKVKEAEKMDLHPSKIQFLIAHKKQLLGEYQMVGWLVWLWKQSTSVLNWYWFKMQCVFVGLLLQFSNNIL